MERKFQEELDDLKQQLLSMGAKVEKNIADAISALINRDRNLAQDVLTRDPEIDSMEVHIDEECFSVLALRQPVARDLRFITTALKIVKDMERIGDMAVDIAERALEIMKEPPIKPYVDLPIMAESAQNMLRRALEAFINRDVVLARQVCADDDQVDDLHDRIFDELTQIMVRNPNTVEQASYLIHVIKYIERIGDHSANVAEMVVFMVEGQDIRHFQKLKGLSN